MADPVEAGTWVEIRQVVRPTNAPELGDDDDDDDDDEVPCFAGHGIAVNSPLIDGLPTAEAKETITNWLENNGFGRRSIMRIAAICFIISAWGSGAASESLEFVVYRVLGGLAVGAVFRKEAERF